MDKIRIENIRSFEFDDFVSNTVLRIGKVNVPFEDDKKRDNNNREKRIGVFDIESNGKEILFGFFDGDQYKHKTIRKVEDVTDVLDWLISVDLSYFYGDYDLPVTLSPFLTISQFSSGRKKNLSDTIYSVIGKSGYFIQKMKNLYRIASPYSESISVNLITFYAGSLYNSYLSFIDVIKQVFGGSAFNDNIMKEWKADKGKRQDFESVRMDDPEVIKYNRLDCIATYQLAKILPLIFPIEVKLTLPATAIDYILKNTHSEFITYMFKGKKYLGLPNTNTVVDTLKYLYKGGLFDSNELGVFDKVYKYDINSMYPFMMSHLPEMELERISNNPKDFTIDDPLLDGVHFNDDAKFVRIYNLCYDNNPKFIASKEAGMLLRVKESCTSLFDFELYNNGKLLTDKIEMNSMIELRIKKLSIFKNVVDEIYRKRLELKKQKNPYEKVFKLIMNSSYGKFGERILTTDSRYKNTVYASMITAMGRTYIQSSDRSSIGYLTDSVFSVRPLNPEIIGDKLGQFKEEGKGKLFIIGNGLYVLDDDNEKMVKYRGFKFGNEKEAEKVIKYVAIELSKGNLVRIKVNTSIMVKNIYTMRVLQGDEVKIGTIEEQIKILSPLNPKQRYEYSSGKWIGHIFRNEKEAKDYKKDLKKRLNEVKPINLNSILDN
jgi:hypothetical protein